MAILNKAHARVQASYVIPVSFPETKAVTKYFDENYGKSVFIEHNAAGIPHDHPIAHIERALTEKMVHDRIKTTHGDGYLIDVGGNPIRHFKNILRKNHKLSKIHCCCPILDSADEMRKVD